MDNNLRSLCEQIQQDILAFADSCDYSGFASETLDDLCEIVVRNFQQFDPAESYHPLSREQSFIINDIEFDVSGHDDAYWGAEWNEAELREELQNEWRGKIVGPTTEDEILDLISDLSGWCVNYVSYDSVIPAS